MTTFDDAARAWLGGVTKAGFVPGTRAAALARLRDLLAELVSAAQAEPFEPDRGFRAGVRLVEQRMAAPQVAGATVRVLGERMPELLGGDPAAVARLPELVGQVAAGFAAAQREAALIAAESMARAEKLTWHRAQRDLQTRLQHALLHEAVTGLPNRAHLRAHLRERIAQREGRIGVCLLRVEEFADLNKALGHDAGDALLAAIGVRIGGGIGGRADFAAHLGDENFALVMDDTGGPDDVVKAAEQAARALARSVDLDGYTPTLTARCGLVEGPAEGTTATAWLRDASVALDWAAADGVPYAVHQSVRATADLQRHRLTAALPTALDRGEVVAHFQPLYKLSDHSIVGFEALARWDRVGPAEFIPFAERTGLIGRIGRHVLAESCEQAARWHRLGHPVTVSVNLSARQLGDRGLVASVADILDRSGLSPESLQLEITESAALDDYHEMLHQLAGLGVRLAVDDFGTGYARLAVLPRLPIHGVKLAAEFLDELDHRDIRGATVLRHTIAFCRDLGITVTGEGIETVAQEKRLRDLGCHLGQGFLFARPDTAEAATALLTEGRLPPRT